MSEGPSFVRYGLLFRVRRTDARRTECDHRGRSDQGRKPRGGARGRSLPVCGTPGVIGARYCEVCRYDFETAPPADTGASAGAVPQAAITPEAAVKPVTQPAQPEPVPQRWDAVIAIDPSLNKVPDPAQPCPAAGIERIFPLDLDENLAGRRSDAKDIHPEIVIANPGISRRHLTFRRRDDGGFIVIELGSTNGTVLNGVPLEPGIPVPLKDGDQLDSAAGPHHNSRALIIREVRQRGI